MPSSRKVGGNWNRGIRAEYQEQAGPRQIYSGVSRAMHGRYMKLYTPDLIFAVAFVINDTVHSRDTVCNRLVRAIAFNVHVNVEQGAKNIALNRH